MNGVAPKFGFTYDGAIVNVYHADAGDGLPRHAHEYDHATICHAGECIIRKENLEMKLTAATGPINLRGGEWHELEAIEDGTVFVNIFSEAKLK